MTETNKLATKKTVRFIWIILIFAAIVLIGLSGAGIGLLVGIDQLLILQARWLVIAGLVCVFVALLGHEVNSRYTGALIDNRYKMSLSRFQVLAWTIVVFSALTAIALERNRKWVDEKKGAFIEDMSQSSPSQQMAKSFALAEDIFVPAEKIEGMALKEGQLVRFETENSNDKIVKNLESLD